MKIKFNILQLLILIFIILIIYGDISWYLHLLNCKHESMHKKMFWISQLFWIPALFALFCYIDEKFKIFKEIEYFLYKQRTIKIK